MEPRRGFRAAPHFQEWEMWKDREAGDDRPPRTRSGAQSPGDGETDSVGPGPWECEASGRLCRLGQRAVPPTPPAWRHPGVPGTGMETAQQVSFCKTGGVAGAAPHPARLPERQPPAVPRRRRLSRKGLVTSLSGSSWPGGRRGQFPGLPDGGRNRAPRMWQGGRWLVPSN